MRQVGHEPLLGEVRNSGQVREGRERPFVPNGCRAVLRAVVPVPAMVPAVLPVTRLCDLGLGLYHGRGHLVPGRCIQVCAVVTSLVRVDTAQDLHAKDGEHDEHDRQEARRLSPRIGELRASGTGQVHSVAKGNGTDTVPGNTPPPSRPLPAALSTPG